MKIFGDFEEKYIQKETAKIVILPVPYDKTSTWLKGSDKGPDAILDASYNLEFYDIETDSEAFKKGIYTAPPILEDTTPEQMVEEVYQATKNWLNLDKFQVILGGEHSVIIGAVKAFYEKFSDLTVLQIDAHADLRNEYNGSRFNHACVMARVRELCPIIQVGIRSMDIEEKKYISPTRVFLAEKLYNQYTWIDDAVDLLTDNVYITIDVDGFDPSVISSTGTPEPGGLNWYQVLKLLKKVVLNSNLVGFDLVELCPNEIDKSSDFIAAKLIYKLLSYKFMIQSKI